MNAMVIPDVIDRCELTQRMRECEQSPGQSVLDHGISVHQTFEKLIRHLRDGADAGTWWRIPAWAYEPELLHRLPSDEVLAEAHIHHDCGKPYCRFEDAQGHVHFPDHAAISERVWLAAGGTPEAARLMRLDMVAHTMSPAEAFDFGLLPEAAALLLTALAEIHSNAAMFGGADSDSFKIKAKRLEKRGKIAVATMLNVSHPTIARTA